MGKGTILVIEDNVDNLDLVRFLLEEGGYSVAGASDGRSGLEIARDMQPTLILLDLAIPEIDGWSLANMLKADAATGHIPVIALTAYTMPGDRKKALDAGCDGFITKPLDIPNFVSMIEAYIPGV
jgi:two-component system, cell cycle response regulator DivK